MLGNGIAGVTAADFVRRGHPDCEIHLVGQESHVLYNRMGISRLVYGRSAMTGLYLLAEQWYAEQRRHRLAEHDRHEHRRASATGGARHRRVTAFDRLILAMGSSSAVPPIDGFGKPGSFVLRSAARRDADPQLCAAHGVPRRPSWPAAVCSAWRPRTPCTSWGCT